jgi:RimJ/RimL family protein N-acetyltransferase
LEKKPDRAAALNMPQNFEPPLILETEHYRLKPLTQGHTELDYAAVMETQQRLQASAPNGWPHAGFTVEENRRDLRHHEQEFADRIGFAFTVLNLDESAIIGCVYFNPPAEPGSDVDVHMWVRERDYPRGLAQHLHRHVDAWLQSHWPFEQINYLRPDYYFAKGGCLCGGVLFYAGPVTGPFELCHCSRCRRSSGSAFAALIGVAEVRFSSGQELVTTCSLPIISKPPAYQQCFCKVCGSPLPDPGAKGWQEVPAGALQAFDLSPDKHIYVDDAPAWSFPDSSLATFTRDEIYHFRKTQQ